MARPRGHRLNPDALEDWLVARCMTRTELARAVGIAPSTLSGLARAVAPNGASTAIALKIAEALNVRPGTLFEDLVGHRVEAAVA